MLTGTGARYLQKERCRAVACLHMPESFIVQFDFELPLVWADGIRGVAKRNDTPQKHGSSFDISTCKNVARGFSASDFSNGNIEPLKSIESTKFDSALG